MERSLLRLLLALEVKNPPADAGDRRDAGLIPGLERCPGVGHSSPLQYSCWKIPWTEEPGRLQSMGLQRVGHDLDPTLRSHKIHAFQAYVAWFLGLSQSWVNITAAYPKKPNVWDLTPSGPFSSWQPQICVWDSLRPHGLEPTRLLFPWNFPGRTTGVVTMPSSKGASHPGMEPRLLHWQVDSTAESPGKPLLSDYVFTSSGHLT